MIAWDLVKDIGLFLAGLLIGAIAYFAKRKIERARENEDLQIQERLLKINSEMKAQNLAPHDLKKLSSLLLAKFAARSPDEEPFAAAAAITKLDSERIITQAEMNQESYEKYEKAELELKQALGRLKTVLASKDRKRFEEAQQAWLKFRERQVALAGGFYEGGSIQPLIYNVEAHALTEARAKELRALYEELESQ